MRETLSPSPPPPIPWVVVNSIVETPTVEPYFVFKFGACF